MIFRPSRLAWVAFLLAICLPLGAAVPKGAAVSKDPSAPKEDEARKAESAEAIKRDYVLQAEDRVRINIFQEPDLSAEVRVSQEGTVTLSLIETIALSGKSVRQAEELIKKLYEKDYLVNAQVTVTVIEYSKRFVKVFGSVENPGVVEFPPEKGLTLLDAISRAGSFTRLADKRKVTITRIGPEGKPDVKLIDADELTKKGVGEDVPLLPNDLINVGERLL